MAFLIRSFIDLRSAGRDATKASYVYSFLTDLHKGVNVMSQGNTNGQGGGGVCACVYVHLLVTHRRWLFKLSMPPLLAGSIVTRWFDSASTDWSRSSRRFPKRLAMMSEGPPLAPPSGETPAACGCPGLATVSSRDRSMP